MGGSQSMFIESTFEGHCPILHNVMFKIDFNLFKLELNCWIFFKLNLFVNQEVNFERNSTI